MATSGTINGTRVGTSPYLKLEWSLLQQDVANNRSELRLVLKCYSQYNVNFSTTKTGNLEGTAFSYSGGMSGSNITVTLYSKTMWFTHNTDGTLSPTLDANFNINITWGGSSLSTLYLSGTVTLPTIPRASIINSFSMGGSLKYNTANSINLSLTRYSSSFTHDITLKLGSYVVKTWAGQGLPTSLSLTAGEVNTMLSKLPTATSSTVTLTVQTKSGSTNIGGLITDTDPVTVDSTVVPTISGLSASIYGSGYDKTIGKFVQLISKVTSSFTPAAGYGSSVASTSIKIRRDSDDADSQTINGSSGTTGNAVQLSGTYEAYATVTDARGRSATAKVTFTVYSYSLPSITAFSAKRTSADETQVDVTQTVSYGTGVGTDNDLTAVIQRRVTGGSFSTLNTTTRTSSPNTYTYVSTGNLITSAYEFKLIVTDKFGKSATSTVTVSTSKVVFSILKDEAVGIGRLPVAGGGVLQVGGNATIDGVLEARNINADTVDGKHASDFVPSNGTANRSGNLNIWGTDISGSYGSAPIEIREVNTVGSAQSADGYAPYLVFHWGGRVQKAIALRSNGDLVLRTEANAGNRIWDSGNLRFRGGKVQVSPTANSPSYATVTYGETFPAEPVLQATAHSMEPYSELRMVSISSPTTTSARVYIYRINTVVTHVWWSAMYRE